MLLDDSETQDRELGCGAHLLNHPSARHRCPCINRQSCLIWQTAPLGFVSKRSLSWRLKEFENWNSPPEKGGSHVQEDFWAYH